MHEASDFSTTSPLLTDFDYSMLVGGKWYLSVFLIGIFLMPNDVEHLYVYIGHLYIVWRNVCLDSLPFLTGLSFYY